jgi:hypothetical protein
VKKATVRWPLACVECALQEETQPPRTLKLSLQEHKLEIVGRLADGKNCRHQEMQRSELFYLAAAKDDTFIRGQSGVRWFAPITHPVCAACDLPDSFSWQWRGAAACAHGAAVPINDYKSSPRYRHLSDEYLRQQKGYWASRSAGTAAALAARADRRGPRGARLAGSRVPSRRSLEPFIESRTLADAQEEVHAAPQVNCSCQCLSSG